MDRELEKCVAGRNTPGPVYGYCHSVGPQILSTKSTGQRAMFGRSGRFGPLSAQSAPGPIYNASTSAFGVQPTHTRRSLPAYGFGTSTRDGAKRVRTIGSAGRERLLQVPRLQGALVLLLHSQLLGPSVKRVHLPLEFSLLIQKISVCVWLWHVHKRRSKHGCIPSVGLPVVKDCFACLDCKVTHADA
jgi:hypothetical protein